MTNIEAAVDGSEMQVDIVTTRTNGTVTIALADDNGSPATHESAAINLETKSGKITIYGDFDAGQTATASTWRALYITGSTSEGGTYTRMGASFEIVVDENGRFGATVDVCVPYIKIGTTNEQNNNGSSLTINYSLIN